MLLNSERNLSGIKRTEYFLYIHFFNACHHLGKYIIEHNLPFWNCVMLLKHIWVLLYSEFFSLDVLGYSVVWFSFFNSSSSVSVSVPDFLSIFNPTLH